MTTYLLVLRIIHILGGAFWAGAAFMLAGYVAPAVREAGQAGTQFMQGLLGKTRFLSVIAVASGLNVLSGLLLYWRLSGNRINLEWITTSGTGMAFTIGGLAGLAALVIGMAVQNRGSRKILAIGRAIQASGGPPTPEQAAEIQSIQESVGRAGVWTSILLVIALLGMASARYLVF